MAGQALEEVGGIGRDLIENHRERKAMGVGGASHGEGRGSTRGERRRGWEALSKRVMGTDIGARGDREHGL